VDGQGKDFSELDWFRRQLDWTDGGLVRLVMLLTGNEGDLQSRTCQCSSSRHRECRCGITKDGSQAPATTPRRGELGVAQQVRRVAAAARTLWRNLRPIHSAHGERMQKKPLPWRVGAHGRPRSVTARAAGPWPSKSEWSRSSNRGSVHSTGKFQNCTNQKG
jgi:hypothetical protein